MLDSLHVLHDDLGQALLEAAPTGLVALGPGGDVVMANRAARDLLALAEPGVEAGLSDGRAEIALRDGRTVMLSRTRAATGHVLIALERNLAPRTDALTGLPDRAGFLDRVDQLAARRKDGIAVMMIDLDRFKSVNDSLGHLAGDALLRLVATRLRATLRDADVISRLGGDEFAVALASSAGAEAVGQRLVTALSRPYLVDHAAAVVGASVGIALAPEHGTDAPSLMRAADLALYSAKANGRGAVRMFDDGLDRAARKRHALADDLRRAIPLQQLELHYQAQRDLGTGKLCGFEALLRWRRGGQGLVPPDEFIPVAEEMGLILPIGDWVIREACRTATKWPDEISVAVNVSPKQLLDRDRLPRAIAASLADTGLAPERLEIEITESALVREAEALEVLHSVRRLGVRVSMDDFGTGYSSLSQLRRFPFDKLKIDRSFVRDIGGCKEAEAVVRAIAALGRSLGMTTIAEGVETERQAAMVHADGCTEIQGYLVSKPVPEAELAKLLNAQAP